jgi:predicted phosphoribosyltransferase
VARVPARDTDSTVFHDRIDAGKQLAAKLIHLRDESPVVLGLPRGGVVVGDPIAGELECPLDIIVVRKLGAPSHQELGIGAIAEHDVKVVNDELIEYLRVSEADLRAVEERERDELRRRVERYRRGKPEIDLGGRAAIIVDDGLATGYTARAAIHAARVRKAAKIVLAVPVGAEDTVQTLRALADDVVAISVPRDLRAVGYWYRDFAQTSDREVLTLLAQHE